MYICLIIFYFILGFMAIPRCVDAMEEGKKFTAALLMVAAFTFTMLAALGLNVWLMEMGL